MEGKKKILMSGGKTVSWTDGDVEGMVTKILVVIAIAFPTVELISTVFWENHLFMESLLRMIGTAGALGFAIVYLRGVRYRLVLSDVLVILSVFFTLLSVVFSLNIENSLGGASKGFSEDLMQMLGYFAIFFAATHVSKVDNRKRIFVAFLVSATLHTISAICQHMKIWPWETINPVDISAAYGLTLHHNFYGAIAVLFSGLTTMIFLIKKTKNIALWYVVALVCFTSAMFSCSRLTWVGIISYLLFIMLFELFQRTKGTKTLLSIRRYILILISFAVVCLCLTLFDEVIVNQLAESAGEIKSGEVQNLGTGRMQIWMVGLNAVLERPLVGMGLDNYAQAYDFYTNSSYVITATKGHCEYIHLMVTQGIPATINYLFLCGYVVLFSIKRIVWEEKEETQRSLVYILLVMVVGYYCQAMFNSSVTNVAPYKWMIMGMLLPRCQQKELKSLRKKRNEDEE